MDRTVKERIEAGVPAGLADTVAALVRPCVTATSKRCDENGIPVGRSKFGGRPDVPAGFEWPMAGRHPCWFIAQVRLADLRPFDTGYRFPQDGLVLFFYHDIDGAPGRKPRILLLPATRLRRIDIVPEERYGGRAFHDENFPAQTLRFTQGYTLPGDPTGFRLTAAQRRKWDRSAVFDFKAEFNEPVVIADHQCFGHPASDSPPRGHALVARLGLGNQYAFFVPDGAIAAQDFSRPRAILECS